MYHSTSGKPRVVIVGSSFAGLTAAIELRRRCGDRAEIVVLDPRPYFTFIPSLIWYPFGLREAEDITFPLRDTYERAGVEFVNDEATAFDLAERIVHTGRGDEISYDRVLIATGPRFAFEKVPGLGPEGHTVSVCTLDHARHAREAWEQFVAEPGPVVVGAAQGASCFGASYEFLLNLEYRMRKAGLRADDRPITFITSEPFLGHFGLGGVGKSDTRVPAYLEKRGIEGIPDSSVKEIRPGEIELDSGRVLPFAYSMIIPPFTGVDAVRDTEGLGNPAGFVPIDSELKHPEHPDVYAAGVDVAVIPPATTTVPWGVPKTGYMSEHMAKVAAQNIAADLIGGERRSQPVEEIPAICVLDAGNTGFVIKAEHVLQEGRTHMMAGPQAHWAKLAFERYFLETRKRGFVRV